MLALWLYTNLTAQDQNHLVNEFRLIIHPIYLQVTSEAAQDYEQILEKMDLEQTLYMSLVDLSGKIIWTNRPDYKNLQDLFLDQALFMDNSYEKTESFYKLSMPIYENNRVNGFAIFEIDKTYLINLTLEDHHAIKVWIVKIIRVLLPILLVFLLILLWFMIYRYKDPTLHILKEKMDQVSKGRYEAIKVNHLSDYKELLLSYNILVEELNYIMKQQANYEGQRRDFLTRVSHELKTPIATINAYIEGLMSPMGNDQENRARYYKIIDEKMKDLMGQIEDLFKYAQEESGRFKYHFKEVYADEVFEKIFETFSGNQKVETKISNKLPKCIVNMDPIRIEQVLMNLVNNARKHSDPSSPITLMAYRQDNHIVIEVQDYGQGILAKDIPYIFDTYYQGQSSQKNDYEGIGLGLSICKDILTEHKGTIKVKSVVNEGTTFIISLPIV